MSKFTERLAALRKGEPEAPGDVEAGPVVVAAPVDGTVIALTDVSDKVFSSGALGPGAAVAPTSTTVLAPVAGQVVTAMPHAYGIRTAEGIEVLVHIGIDTVNLEGQHFSPQVEQGATVDAGEALASVDFAALTEAGYDVSTLVIVTNPGGDRAVTAAGPSEVAAGEALLTVG